MKTIRINYGIWADIIHSPDDGGWHGELYNRHGYYLGSTKTRLTFCQAREDAERLAINLPLGAAEKKVDDHANQPAKA